MRKMAPAISCWTGPAQLRWMFLCECERGTKFDLKKSSLCARTDYGSGISKNADSVHQDPMGTSQPGAKILVIEASELDQIHHSVHKRFSLCIFKTVSGILFELLLSSEIKS